MKLTEHTAVIRKEGAFGKRGGRFIKGLTFKERGRTICLVSFVVTLLFCYLLSMPSHVCSADEIPPHVMTVIEQQAAREFPDDENLRLLTIERQGNAYIAVRNYSNTKIPQNILASIKKRATFECPGDYCSQLYLIESQSRDYLYLRDYLPKEVPQQVFIKIMQNAELEFPDDFSTRRLIVDAKVKKYWELQRVSSLDGAVREVKHPDASKQTLPEIAPQAVKTEGQVSDATPVQQGGGVEKVAAEKRYHVIKKGENLFRISLKYGLSVEELCHINGISAQDIIKPGQKLLVTP